MSMFDYLTTEQYFHILLLMFAVGANPKQGFIAFDQWLNTRLGGMADETLSARAWRLRSASRYWHVARIAIDCLFFFQKEHCKSAYLSEIDRKQLPSEYRRT